MSTCACQSPMGPLYHPKMGYYAPMKASRMRSETTFARGSPCYNCAPMDGVSRALTDDRPSPTQSAEFSYTIVQDVVISTTASTTRVFNPWTLLPI